MPLDPNAGNLTAPFVNGFTAAPMAGKVQFWYYGTTGNGTTGISRSDEAYLYAGFADVHRLRSSRFILLAHIVSPGAAGDTTAANGLTKLAANFAGYVIAQAQFQYCHGVASISANVPGFGTRDLPRLDASILIRPTATRRRL